MKTILRLFSLVLCLLTAVNPLHAQWVNTGATNTTVNALAVSGTNLFAGTNGGVPLSGVFRSTDDGVNWTRVITGLSNNNVYALAVSGANLFAGVYDGVYLSTNNGSNWTAVNNGLAYTYVLSLGVFGTNLFAGTFGGGVFLSTNNGTSWAEANTGLTSTTVHALAASGTHLFAGTSGGVFRSTNNGTNWTAANTGLTGTSVAVFVVSGTNIFAGTSGNGVFLSTNNGTNWTALGTSGLTNTGVRALAISGTNIFAGTWGSGVLVTTNNGASWTSINSTGLTNARVHALAVSGSNLIAGIDIGVPTIYDGVWRWQLSQMTTSVEKMVTNLPTNFNLGHNYPNPFNPSTTIRFSIPTPSFVSLKVFNVLGAEIASLVDENKPSGEYQATWDANGYPSGVVFLRLMWGGGGFTGNKYILKCGRSGEIQQKDHPSVVFSNTTAYIMPAIVE